MSAERIAERINEMPRGKAKTHNPAEGYQRPGGNSEAGPGTAYGAPAPPADFIGGETLENNGGRMSLLIKGIRPAPIGGDQFDQGPGWFFDVTSKGVPFTMRITKDSKRHRQLHDRFGNSPVGETIVVRLTKPSDKAGNAKWLIEE
jgi:hypothetical protein